MMPNDLAERLAQEEYMQSLNVVFTGRNQVEVRTEPVAAPGPGTVLVRASKTLISTGTEGIALGRLFEEGSHWDRWVTYPFHPGYSMAGRVVAVGAGVAGVGEGDRVAARKPHHQYVTVSRSALTPIPDGVSDEEATWFGLANIVQNGVRRAEHCLGESVAVIGLGPLGQLVVQYLRLLGARHVIAIDRAAQRLELACARGATAAVNASAADAREEVLRLTDGPGVDVVYDVTGAPGVLPSALRLLRRFGRLVLLGDTGTPTEQRLTGDVVTKGLRIVGAHDSNPPAESSDHAYWSHARMTELFFAYLQRGDMRVHDLITHRYAPAEAPQAYGLLSEQRFATMGVIFDWLQA
jgi:2-desacetyl-2-hydroxyethyl bacteriochlorophyllide A dehydrogenase